VVHPQLNHEGLPLDGAIMNVGSHNFHFGKSPIPLPLSFQGVKAQSSCKI